MTRIIFTLLLAIFAAGFSGAARAQDAFYVQVKAEATLAEAEAEALALTQEFGDEVKGFRLANLYAVALGPYDRDLAVQTLQTLLAQNAVPRDSYINSSARYGARFWPKGAVDLTPAVTEAQIAGETPGLTDLTPEPPRTETVAEARQSERALTREDRELIQTALQWEGFYDLRIDGDFGGGTRRAMAAYQAAMGYDNTGVLTTRQRDALVNGYQSALASVGLEGVRDEVAGIEMQLPMAMVAFDRYDPPFAHYDSTDGDVKVLLISQRGTRSTLAGLYDVMQTLEIVPAEGYRERNRDWFVLTGANDDIQSYTYARHENGIIRGFTMTWRPEDAKLMKKIAEVMYASFGTIDDLVMEAAQATAPSRDQRPDLLSGLQIRRPVKSRSGFFVAENGTAVTAVEAVQGCARVTLSDQYDVEVVMEDPTLGVAVLRPTTPLAPLGVARFAEGIARLRAPVAVAGFSYEGTLGAPTLTLGSLAGLKGLNGEEALERLDVAVTPGDAGGPVLDETGGVLGMLLPRVEMAGRMLPEGVAFSARADAIVAALAQAGVAVNQGPGAGSLDPVDLQRIGTDMTVLVSCWDN